MVSMMNDNSIFDLYHRVHRELIKNLRELLRPYDFNRGEIPVLAWLIKDGDGVSQKKIRGDIPVCKSTMSKTVDNLSEKGYLRKEKDFKDKRSTLIYLTEKGKKVEDIIRETDRTVEDIMLKGFSSDERENLSKYLQKISRNLRESKK